MFGKRLDVVVTYVESRAKPTVNSETWLCPSNFVLCRSSCFIVKAAKWA